MISHHLPKGVFVVNLQLQTRACKDRNAAIIFKLLGHRTRGTGPMWTKTLVEHIYMLKTIFVLYFKF